MEDFIVVIFTEGLLRCYVGRFYAAHLPPTSAATPSVADVEPRANAYNLPSFNMGIVIKSISRGFLTSTTMRLTPQLNYIFNLSDKE